jgi:adenylate kinase family enzyme
MKIRIIGTMGSGKSFLSKRLEQELKIPHYDLDDVFFKVKHSVRRSDKEITKIIKKILKGKNWIIEGIQYYDHNIEKTFAQANILIWVDPSLHKIPYRLIKRFMKRLFDKSEKAKDTISLLKGSLKYKLNINSKSKLAHKKYIKKYDKKSVILKNNKQINEFLKTLK